MADLHIYSDVSIPTDPQSKGVIGVGMVFVVDDEIINVETKVLPATMNSSRSDLGELRGISEALKFFVRDQHLYDHVHLYNDNLTLMEQFSMSVQHVGIKCKPEWEAAAPLIKQQMKTIDPFIRSRKLRMFQIGREGDPFIQIADYFSRTCYVGVYPVGAINKVRCYLRKREYTNQHVLNAVNTINARLGLNHPVA